MEEKEDHRPPRPKALMFSGGDRIGRCAVHVFVAVALMHLFLLPDSRILASAAVICTSDAECVARLRPGSKCKVASGGEGYCTNPFASGCLRAILGEELFPKLRMCNSDDQGEGTSTGISEDDEGYGSTYTHCTPPDLNYTEIRIAAANWESSMFLSFVHQIVMSEMLGVPATIETGSEDPAKHLSFYDDKNGFPYPGRAYPFNELKTADAAPGGRGDCRLIVQKDGDEKHKPPCAHVMPEVWNGQRKAWQEAQREGYVEPPHGSGMVGKISWYVPKFVAQDVDASLASAYGLWGEENRRKLADTFLRPTTWEDYCNEVSPTGCRRGSDGEGESESESDGAGADDGNDGGGGGGGGGGSAEEAASRPPTQDEIDDGTGGKYFVRGLYKGHFRRTDANDCDADPTGCTGHFVDAPCTWSTNFQQQAYWNGVALRSDGALEPNGGYSYGEMIDIWTAANETRSPVMMWWWRPDPTIQAWRGTGGEFLPVAMPEPTEECQKARIGSDERCDPDPWVRRGDPGGGCDDEAHSLQTIVAASLGRDAYGEGEAARSPAYETIKSLRVSDLAMDGMLKSWMELGVDTYGYDPRETVCTWVAENIDELSAFIPRGFPRELVREGWYDSAAPLLYSSMGVALVVVLSVIVTSALVWKYRGRRVIRAAQVNFLSIILVGFFLLSAAAIVYVLEPSTTVCVTQQWLVTLGYTLSLVPLLVKVAAINKLTHSAKKMKRVQLSKKKLLGQVLAVALCVVVYLIVWTSIDAPTRQEDLVLVSEAEGVVELSLSCSSSSNVWFIVVVAWELLLLVCATVLAFQARKVRQSFNESGKLASLVYAHFLFMVLRVIVYLLSFLEVMAPNKEAGLTSLLLSFNTLVAILIYFGPKFLQVIGKDDSSLRSSPYVSQRSLNVSTASEVLNNHGCNSSPNVSQRSLGSNLSRRNYLAESTKRSDNDSFSRRSLLHSTASSAERSATRQDQINTDGVIRKGCTSKRVSFQNLSSEESSEDDESIGENGNEIPADKAEDSGTKTPSLESEESAYLTPEEKEEEEEKTEEA